MTNELDDQSPMARALRLARRGLGWVEPNPMVGAVMVRDGRVIGEGYHHEFGQAHAEVEALEDCRRRGEVTTGATMFVTLEPCSHHGQTPPCVEAMMDAGLTRAVVAMTDPSEHAAGRGFHILRDAGIDVEVAEVGSVHARQAWRLNRPFVKRVTSGLPWVIVKWAQTLDGYSATAAGDSQWISNDQSRQRVHELRARVDAVITGMGTVLADNPRLTARNVTVKRQARRVIVGEAGTLGDKAALAMLHEDGPPVDFYPHQDDLHSLLSDLVREHQATNVLVEAGGGLVGALLNQGLVDQILAFVGPKLLGDGQGKSVVRGLEVPTIDQATALKLDHVERLGDDVLLDYQVGQGDR